MAHHAVWVVVGAVVMVPVAAVEVPVAAVEVEGSMEGSGKAHASPDERSTCPKSHCLH